MLNILQKYQCRMGRTWWIKAAKKEQVMLMFKKMKPVIG
jgi:hypothetical protein